MSDTPRAMTPNLRFHMVFIGTNEYIVELLLMPSNTTVPFYHLFVALIYSIKGGRERGMYNVVPNTAVDEGMLIL